MRYTVYIKYIDNKEIYPVMTECDIVKVEDDILKCISAIDYTRRAIGIPLHHVRSYEIVEKLEKKETL
jgi:hypothetical protein